MVPISMTLNARTSVTYHFTLHSLFCGSLCISE